MAEVSRRKKWLLRLKQGFKKSDKAPSALASAGDVTEVRDQKLESGNIEERKDRAEATGQKTNEVRDQTQEGGDIAQPKDRAQATAKTRKPLALPPPAPESVRVPSHPLCFAPDGEYLASVSADHAIRLWAWEADANPTPIHVLRGHIDEIRSIAISQDGKLLASASSDRTVRLWDLADGKASAPMRTHVLAGGAMAVTFSADGNALAAGDGENLIRVWNASSGEPRTELKGHLGAVSSVAFSPCGKRLASGSRDETIRIWDAEKGELLSELSHVGPVVSVAFDPSGQRLASAVSSEVNRPVSIWDIDTGVCLCSVGIPISMRRISSISFSASGKRLALGLGDRTFFMWNLRRGEAVEMTEDGVWSVASTLGEISTKIFDGGKDPSHPPKMLHQDSQAGLPQLPKSEAANKAETADEAHYAPPRAKLEPASVSRAKKASRSIGSGGSLSRPRTCHRCMGYLDVKPGSTEMCRC